MPRVRTRSVEWLLSLLVLRNGRAVNRSWLAGTLWPESAESQALQNLRHDLVSLRKALGSERARIQSPTRDTLAFNLEGVEVDIQRFDQAIQKGDEDSLRSAAAAYRGLLLEGCQEEWVFLEREYRQQECLIALETLSEKAEQRGDFSEALAFLRRAEGLDNLRASTQRRLMRVLAASGDKPAALLSYRDYRFRLRHEMNVEPDEDTTRLFQHIRTVGKAGSEKPPGESRKIEIVSPPLNSQSLPPSSLPHPLTTLIGREEAVREVVRRVTSSRLVTLVGTGGVGKTRLCIQVASEAADNFLNGAVFVALATLADPARLLDFLSSTLGMREEGSLEEEALLYALVGWLSTQSVLLVLDNCEHLIEATAALCQTLLERCPHLHILATSRQRLGLTGEAVWRVPSLSSPEPDQLPLHEESSVAYVLQYPAVQLFVERAEMARCGFRLAGEREAQEVARICQRLDGIPLAIELAAARAGLLTPGQIADRLEDRFRLLAGGSRGVLPRHQTLRALIDWSYDLLDDQESALLRCLSVFVGGWSLEAAESLFAEQPLWNSASDILELLTSLADKSLVLVEEQKGSLRYRMLETVREYGQQKLQESRQTGALRARHADYYLALAEQAEPFLEKPEPIWLDRLESEHDNLRAALTYYTAQEETLEKAVRLVAALEVFWSLRGHMSERRTWLLSLSIRQTPPTEARARVLAVAGWLLIAVGNPTMGKQYYVESLTIMQRLGDKRGIAVALSGLAALESNPRESRVLAEKSLALMREVGERKGMADSLYHLGLIARQSGDHDQAHACWMEANALNEEMGIKGGLVLCRLGDLAVASGDYAAARRFFERFVTERDEIGDRWSVAWGLKGFGALAWAEERLERAAAILGASFALKESIGKRLSEAERLPYESMRMALQEAAGEAVVTAAWEAGRSVTYEQALKLALKNETR